MNKIDKMLNEIKIDEYGNWYVPNRKKYNLTIEEFMEFETKRINEFSNENIRNTKYKYHYYSDKKEEHNE